MNTLSKIIEELKISQAVKVTAAGLKRANDISDSYDDCINIVMDHFALFEKELRAERTASFKSGQHHSMSQFETNIKKVINQLTDLIPETNAD